jgi:hypothetical protein
MKLFLNGEEVLNQPYGAAKGLRMRQMLLPVRLRRGLNLFLASYLFRKPLVEIYRLVVVPLLVLFVTVILITYVPWLSTVLVGLFGG